ncbi:MAG: SMP-30/gluconolactonase/LRE family protein [Solirubrobacterales bacterium]|nr:SMP-30/gluconolactonase/LRE family protein [Solirubrobacterales bacterium]
MRWGEGPRWRDGVLWLSDTQGSKLWTDSSGSWQATELESPCNGLAFLPDGRLVAAMMKEPRICVWTGHELAPYAELPGARAPLGDMTVDAAGNLYVDEVGYNRHLGEAPRPGRILRVAADRAVTTAATDVDFPNGLAVIDGGRTLVVAETWKQRLLAFTVAAEGSLVERRVYADVATLLGPDARPDGIWPAGDRGVWACCLTANRVVQIDDGQVVRSLDTGSGLAIACCADAEGSRLFVTVADTAGLELNDAIAAGAVSTTVIIYDL